MRWFAGTGDLVQAEGDANAEGIVKNVPPLHRTVRDKVLPVFQQEPQEKGGKGTYEFLATVPAQTEQEEHCSAECQPMDFPMQDPDRSRPCWLK